MVKKFSNIQNKPFVMTVKPGRYAWCSCGASSKAPFCDGSHGELGMYPVIEIVEEEKQVAWCGCKSTETPPFCDGTHKKYENESL